MLAHPNIDPVALQLGPLKIHWYGSCYLIGFWGRWWLGAVRCVASRTVVVTRWEWATSTPIRC